MVRPLVLIVPLVTFALALGLLALLQRSDETSNAQARVATPSLPPDATTDEQIAALRAAVRTAPADKRPFAQLGSVYLQKSAESGDPAWYGRAEEVLRRALRANPRDVDAVTGLGNLALSRHDFRAARDLGERARRLQPEGNAGFPVLVDAQIELGRYDDARRTLQQFVDRRPALPSYARVSYFRELEGDLAGAAAAMRLAASAGGSPFNVAAVQVLLGDLEFKRGRQGASRKAYLASLASLPGNADAEAGLARLDAAAGRTRTALRRYRKLAGQPTATPEVIRELGELELAAGLGMRAKSTLARVPAAEQRYARNGENTDVELAGFEADHGSPRRAVALAARGRRIHPSIRSDHALGWALTRAGRPEHGARLIARAIDHGWREPIVLYHAGMTAKAAGRKADARRMLRRALAGNPRFSPLYAPRARRALDDLNRSAGGR